MMEKDNQQTVNFDQTAVSPLNSQVTFLDPLTKQPRQLLGGLVFAGAPLFISRLSRHPFKPALRAVKSGPSELTNVPRRMG